MSVNFSHQLNNILSHSDRPVVGTALIAAGFLPNLHWFDSSHLSAIYFALLIPPAAFHCWTWFKKSILPYFKKMIKNGN